jgi:hypothetical protein
MSPEEARHAAMRSFGNSTILKEEARDTWGWIWLEEVWQDLRRGIRLLPQESRFTAVAIEMIRAVTLVWLFAGIRADEIRRMRVGCVRWQSENDHWRTNRGGGTLVYLYRRFKLAERNR